MTMKKYFLFVLGLCMSAMGLQAALYERDAQTGFYNYTGEALDEVYAVDFSDLQPTDECYVEGTTKHDSQKILEFQKLGLYKFCYKNERSIAGETFSPLLWNNNTADDGANNTVAVAYRPTVYFPKFKNGIHKLIVSGFGGSMFIQAKNAAGAWVGLKDVAPNASMANLPLSKAACVYDTVLINSADVKEISINRNSGGYFFLVNVQIVPMGHEQDIVPVSSLAITPNTANMEVSQTLQLTAKKTPFNATAEVEWSSQNSAIAQVSSEGLVTAMSAGEVEIYAECGGQKDVCKVSIIGETPVTSIELDATSISIAEGKYARLNAVVLPINASNPIVTWTSLDENIATVEGGLVHGLVEGKTKIIAKAGDKQATCDVEVYWEMPEDCNYQLVEYYDGCTYYEWYGEAQTKGFTIDFTKWNYEDLADPNWPDFATTQAQGHSDQIVEKDLLGFYQWVIYENRDLTSDGFSGSQNVLFNGGYTYLDGERLGAGVVPLCKRPAIYFPTFKNGIKQVRITGVSHNNVRPLSVSYKAFMPNSQGGDSTIMAGLPSLEFGKEWDEYVIDNQNETVTDLRISRNSTDYWFIGSIEVIPFGGTAVESVLDNRLEVRAVTGGILFNAKEDLTANIYTILGTTLHTIQVRAGVHTMVPMAKGVYIVNNQKIIVDK